jgi:hypothetical protein
MTTESEKPRIARSRISKNLGFPVGYELLRQHLATAMPLSEIRFSFCSHPTVFASEFTRMLANQQPHCILRVERRHAVQSPTVQPAHWHFTVYPVPREQKSAARSALIATAFPKLRDFISRAPTHANYYNRVDAIFDPVERTIRAEPLWGL